jgi:hypothetical protein
MGTLPLLLVILIHRRKKYAMLAMAMAPIISVILMITFKGPSFSVYQSEF